MCNKNNNKFKQNETNCTITITAPVAVEEEQVINIYEEDDDDENGVDDDGDNQIMNDDFDSGIDSRSGSKGTTTETDVYAATLLKAKVLPIPKGYFTTHGLKIRRYNVKRLPWFIIVMCIVQITLYIIANECINHWLMFMPEYRSVEYWRYSTYTLLHSDLIHLLLNICLQCLIGFCLECEQGHWKVALVYIVGGISGSLATAYFQPQLSLLGASASIYAMLMSHIPHLVKNFTQLPHRYLRIIALIILCLSDVGFSTFHFLVNHNTNPRICLEAHIAGGISGLCLGFFIYRAIDCNRLFSITK